MMFSRPVFAAMRSVAIIFVTLIVITAFTSGGQCLTCLTQPTADAQGNAVEGTVAAGERIDQMIEG